MTICSTDRIENTVSNDTHIVGVFTDPLLRNGLHNPVLLLCARMLRALPSNGRCLQSQLLATGLYATQYIRIQFIPHWKRVTSLLQSPAVGAVQRNNRCLL
jgi:hypothetical protein